MAFETIVLTDKKTREHFYFASMDGETFYEVSRLPSEEEFRPLWKRNRARYVLCFDRNFFKEQMFGPGFSYLVGM